MIKNFTKEDILKSAIDLNVKYIRLQFTDIMGVVKNVEIPYTRLEVALNNEIMFDGSSIEGFVRIQEADMYLYPDFSTWLILSWENSSYGNVARLICDVYTPAKQPFIGDPRSTLKKEIEVMKKMGFTKFNVGVEPEFFLFKIDSEGNPTLKFNDLGGYFDMSPIDGAEDCRRDIVLELEKLGFDMEAAHHEVAYGQHEINFRFDNALEACDNIQTFKIVVKNVAKRHGLHATFMPKPIAGISGSGMHVNCSLSDAKNNNLFYDAKDPIGLSKTARNWIGGILAHARQFSLVTNPIVNSYKRLVPGYEAPCYISWSDANRSTMIRIPASRGKGTRTEIRSVDTAANPYLAITAILAAGLDGIKNETVVEPVSINLFALSRQEREALGVKNLPANLYDAVKDFKNSALMKNVLGEHIFEKLIEAKYQEWNAYSTAVHEWEIKRYLPII